jgi:outer membrane protein TolC
MNKIVKALLFGLLIAGNSIFTSGQSTTPLADTLQLNMQQVWTKAEEHSRAIGIKKKAVSIRNEEVKDAEMERFPELGVAGSLEKATNIPIYEKGLLKPPVQHEVIHTLYRLGTDFNLTVYNGNKLNFKIEEDKILQQIAVIQNDQTASDIRYKAASLYLDLQKSLLFQDVIKQDIVDQEKQLSEIKDFQKNGVVLKSDVLRAELDLSNRQMTLVQIRNDILIANQKLNIIMGEPDERVVRPIDPVVSSDSVINSYEACLTTAMAHSFPYHISEQQTERSKIHLKQIKANVSPKVSLYGDFYYANPQIFLYPYNPYWYSLGIAGVKASFPISSLYHNVHKERAAKLELEQEEEVHKDTEDKVRQQVKEAYLRYKEALIQIDVATVNIKRAQENARIVKNNYFNQAVLITDLLDADVQVLQARFDLTAAKIMAHNKYYLLQNIIGTL